MENNALPPQLLQPQPFPLRFRILTALALSLLIGAAAYIYTNFSQRQDVMAKKQAEMQAAVAADLRSAAARSDALHEQAVRSAMLPGASTTTINSETEGHMAVLKDKNFSYAPLPTKSMQQMLSDMAGERKQVNVAINDKDLTNRVASPSQNQPGELTLKNIPPGSAAAQAGLPYAPVAYKSFNSASTYADFCGTHKGTRFPQADFDRQMVVMLVSNSTFPNKIFQIVSAKEEGGSVKVKYRVNIFAASEGGEDTFTAVTVKKSKAKIALEQIP